MNNNKIVLQPHNLRFPKYEQDKRPKAQVEKNKRTFRLEDSS